MTGFLTDGVWLPLVLGHTRMDSPNSTSDFATQPARPKPRTHWTISGRIGALKTAGRGTVSLRRWPSPEAMDTVGRVAMLTVYLVIAAFEELQSPNTLVYEVVNGSILGCVRCK